MNENWVSVSEIFKVSCRGCRNGRKLYEISSRRRV